MSPINPARDARHLDKIFLSLKMTNLIAYKVGRRWRQDSSFNNFYQDAAPLALKSYQYILKIGSLMKQLQRAFPDNLIYISEAASIIQPKGY